jgi:serine/threonine-protein kinase
MSVLESTLAGTLPADEEAALYRHLETCASCSSALERLAGGADWCDEAATMLHDAELNEGAPADEEWSAADFSVEHLEPSDEPNVLGRLGGYDVLEVIGQGGMGVVLKGFDRELRRCVAIKVLAPHLGASSLAKQRFAREAQAAASIVHPNVLAIHQVQPGGKLPFLVMPLLAGESLAQRLAKQGRLELKEVLRIGMQSAAGLAAAHEQGLVHRDVKPANILLEKGVERAVLTDFGLARAADDVTLTRWGIIAGTPQYMSPEQARGEPLDGRSDLFSLGCVLYEMATGVSPFRSDSVVATLRRLVDESPRAMAALNPELPPWFIHIVERLLEKDPARRFSSAQEVSDLLEGCLAHVQQPARAPLPAAVRSVVSRKQGVSRPRIWKAVAMIAALGIGVFAFFFAFTNPPDIAGRWHGEGWGDVVLSATNDGTGEYTGTYTDTPEGRPGAIELQWSRIERRYNGTWHEGTERFGEISLRLVDDEIRGARTTDPQSREEETRPQLADFSWQPGSASHESEDSTVPPAVTSATDNEADPNDLTGTWNVTRFLGEEELSSFTLELNQEDQRLTGTISWADGSTSEIASVQVAESVISFDVERENFVQHYSGTRKGNIIEGNWAAGIAVFEWRAVRVAANDTEDRFGVMPAPSSTEESSLPEQLRATREHIDRIEELIADAPVTTNYLAEIFEQTPGVEGDYRLRENVVVNPIRRAEVSLMDDVPLGTVYYMPASEGFYIQWDDIAASTLHYYGPFYGVELETLGLVPIAQTAEGAIESALDQITDAHFQAAPLSIVMEYISRSHDIPIHLDEAAFTEAGLSIDVEISYDTPGVTLRSALAIMLEDVNGVRLTYVIEDEVLKITTEAAAAENEEQAVSGDLERLQGTWEAEVRSGGLDGVIRLTIEGTAFTEVTSYPQHSDQEIAEGTIQGSITLGESTNPRQMLVTLDSMTLITIVEGREFIVPIHEIPQHMYAIYELDEQTLTRRTSDNRFPTEFDDRDQYQFVFHRLEDDAGESGEENDQSQLPAQDQGDEDDDEIRRDLGLLQGTWDSSNESTAELPGRRLIIEGSAFTDIQTYPDTPEITHTGRIEILATDPRRILLSIDSASSADDRRIPRTVPAIYFLDDERLTIRMGRDEFPNEFDASDPRQIVYERREGDGEALSVEGRTQRQGERAGGGDEHESDDSAPVTREELIGFWSGNDNGLAQVFFTLELSDDGSFTLERRDLAPQFEETTRGLWELDADAARLILKQESDTAPGGLEFTDSVSVIREAGECVLVHDVQGRYVRHDSE